MAIAMQFLLLFLVLSSWTKRQRFQTTSSLTVRILSVFHCYIPDGSSLDGSSFDSVDKLLEAWSGPMPYDEQLIQMAKKLDLPNFGADGMGTGKNLDTAYQFWDETLALGDFSNGLGDEGVSGSPGDSTESYMTMGGRWENPSQVEDPNASP